GTDVKSIVRGRPGDTFPRLLGHGEVSGVVEKVGEGITKFHVGQRVVAHNSAPCLTCRMCLKGLYSLCEDFFYVKGAYQEYHLIPSRVAKVNMFEIPDNITFEEAAQLEPFSCAVYGAAASKIKLGDNVAIIGSGAQGLYFVRLTKLYGAAKVIVSGHHDFRLNIAKKFGADEVINAHKEDAVEKVKELTGGYGADVVITAAGKPAAWEQAVMMAAKGGIINQYGGCAPGTTFTVPTGRIHYDMITVFGTFHTTPYYVHKAWELIKSRMADLRPIVTHRMPLDDVKEAFNLLMTSKKALKIAIMP
ncbi:MAG: zinc-binding dehydrogenase, partial [Candidatus Bathyarchaeota archaeon]|nr:zinc-binding dehydrogenase [Candidatus Bathyarchaeota archaeon]